MASQDISNRYGHFPLQEAVRGATARAIFWLSAFPRTDKVLEIMCRADRS